MKFKNIRYTPGGGAELIDMSVDDPGPGQVQIENTACGICSWDLQTFRAGSDSASAAPPGHEGVGYVTKLGAGVSDVEIGQRVAGGGFGRVRNAPANRLYKIPDSNLADQHWIVEPASCVVTGIDCCRIKVGERLAMVGCGFMGLMMVQGLQGMGLDQLIALDVDDRRLAMAKEFGATEAHNVTSGDFEEVKRDLQSRGIDVVVDTSGAQSGLDLATAIVKRAGLINLFGWIKGTQATFNPTTWHGKAISIVNSSPAAQLRDPFPVAIRLIQNGVIDLKPLVTHVVPIEEFPSFMSKATTGQVDGYIKGVISTVA
ncbi:MAG: zinc-binding dehydrogenase [Gammaproteobacteria bacterium]|nr:zinc-binding dehydrogenase [Gammaproteobacteria bacterium]